MSPISPVECTMALFFVLTVGAITLAAMHAIFAMDVEDEVAP
jgi:hypothetical protein